MIKIYKGAFSGTLPITASGTGSGVLASYKVYGNTEQAGTPTPASPIEPQECGDRTVNIIDDYLEQAYIGSLAQGVVSSYSTIDLALFPIEQDSTYTIRRYGASMELYVGFFTSKPQIGSVTYDQAIHAPTPTEASTFTFTAPITGWAAVRSSRNTSPKATVFATEGSTTPETYIPYGYKLPLTSAGQGVDIYLGESQTTRRVKKLVLTGEEAWGKYTASTAFPSHFILSNAVNGRLSGIAPLCTHYIGSTATNYSGVGVNRVSVSTIPASGEQSRLTINDPAYTDLSDFKTYLQQQYANGTPVTVWYVLENTTTSILNEPLRKIDDYADTIGSTQTTAQIPTSATSTTVSWTGSSLAPSQFEGVAGWGNLPVRKLKGIPYSGTLPAVLTGTKAGYLHKYKVYGNAGENLFNLDRQPSNTWTMDTAYYINGGVANDKTVNSSLVTVTISNNELTVSSPSASSRGAGFIIPVSPSTSYTISCTTSGATVGDTESVVVYGFIAQDGTITRYDAARGSNPIHTLTTNDDEYYVYLVFRKMSGTLTYSNIMLVEGSTAPSSYIPYEECGEETENLLKIEPGMLDAANWTLRPAATATYFMYYLLPEDTADRLRRIGTVAGTTYLIPGGSYYSGEILAITSSMKATGVTNAERLLQNDGTQLQYSAGVSGYTDIYLCIGYGPGITSSNQQLLVDSMFDNYDIMLNVGTVPLPYEPYGYKLPLTSGSTSVDIYIGDDTLSTEEYADSGTGKVYRMVGGTLTPVDPPVPFPEIPTSANSTTISWAGERLAPSQFDSIQEWVEIPTYKRVSGAWVADN